MDSAPLFPVAVPPGVVAVPPVRSLAELRTACSPELAWVWEGYLAAGDVTLFTSQWKSGKTTLLSVLLAKLESGGELAGRRVAPGRAVVVSEESPGQWLRRADKLGLGSDIGFVCRPFLGKPTRDQWLALIEQLACHCASPGTLAVIDPLASFLPGEENHAGQVLHNLAALRRLTEQGAAVLLLHHPRKRDALAEEAGRGSGALHGRVDILLRMSRTARYDPADRRRRLRAESRHEQTPLVRVIELNEAGTDYRVVEDVLPEDAEMDLGWEEVRALLEEAPHKLTRPQILMRWPEDGTAPSEQTLWRCMSRAVERGLLCRDGVGHRNDPHYYWLPGKVEEWERDPLLGPLQRQVEMIRQRRGTGSSALALPDLGARQFRE